MAARSGEPRTVVVVHERSAFIALPADLVAWTLRTRTSRAFPAPCELAKVGSTTTTHVAWAGGVTPGGEKETRIGVPHALASVLGLADGDDVMFSFGADDVAEAQSVVVTPVTRDDWEAVLAQAEAMEATALAQIGIAAMNQIVPFFAPGGGKPLYVRVTSITPEASAARLVPNTELIVEPWSAAKDDVAANAFCLNDWANTFDWTKTSTVLRLQIAGEKCVNLMQTRGAAVEYEGRDFTQEMDVPWNGALAVSRATATEHNVRHGSFVRAFKYDMEREFDLSRFADAPDEGDEDVPQIFLRVVVFEEDDVVAPGHAALTTSAAAALELFQGDMLRMKEVNASASIAATSFTACLRPVLPPLPSERFPDPAAADGLFTKRRTVLSLARALGPLYTIALGLNAPELDLDGAATTSMCDSSARALFLSWLRTHCSLDSENDDDKETVMMNSKTVLTFNIPGASVASAMFELELKYPAALRVQSPERGVAVRLKDVLAAAIDGSQDRLRSAIRFELGPPIRLPKTTPLRNPAVGVTVWPVMTEDDALAHIPGAKLREHADELLKRLKTSLWFDAIELRYTEFGVGMCPGTLVTGPKGRGRSRLVKALCKLMTKDIRALSCVVEIDCERLPKPHIKTLEAIRAAIDAARVRRPSICYFLNLESICGLGPDGDDDEDANEFHLAALIADTMFENAEDDAVTFIATVSDRAALRKPLRDEEIFEYEFEIRKPDASARRDILASYAAHRGGEIAPDVLDEYSERTDGFDVADLQIIIDRAVNSVHDRERSAGVAKKQSDSNDALPVALRLLTLDLKKACDGYVPIDQAKLSKDDKNKTSVDNYVDGFETIGGLEDLKAILDDAMALPARFPQIFKQCPLRLPTGVLLYGAPGCGKTALAKAAIANAKLRSITIKGPELFSKYYGESEGSLRKLFQRAQDAAPCALFFDEFESLVPRRGSSDGGVSDRMVNQFLTLLDGVDGLVGVFVICATTRPDLIDPAVLRPGRLDHLLYCPLPDAEARVKIMRTICREEKFAPGIDLETIARNAEGQTGADLESFVGECGSRAVHRILRDYQAAVDRGENVVEPNEQPTIVAEDVEEALKLSRPSLAPDTARFFTTIHENFRSKRGGGDTSPFAFAIEPGARDGAKQRFAGQ